jgi:hypothetical protein
MVLVVWSGSGWFGLVCKGLGWFTLMDHFSGLWVYFGYPKGSCVFAGICWLSFLGLFSSEDLGALGVRGG